VLTRTAIGLITLLLLLTRFTQAEEVAALSICDAAKTSGQECLLVSDQSGDVVLKASNQLASEARLEIPAGLICTTRDGSAKCVILREMIITLPPNGSQTRTLSVTPISGTFVAGEKLRPTSEELEKLKPLLKYLADHPETTQAASQLAALCLIRDVDFAKWLATLPAQAAPSNSNLEVALDAFEVLRQVAPDGSFSLQRDAQLKMLALHIPETRGKAMRVYGINLQPAAVDVPSLPNISQLLHTKPGDNCPICRQRAAAERLQNSL